MQRIITKHCKILIQLFFSLFSFQQLNFNKEFVPRGVTYYNKTIRMDTNPIRTAFNVCKQLISKGVSKTNVKSEILLFFFWQHSRKCSYCLFTSQNSKKCNLWMFQVATMAVSCGLIYAKSNLVMTPKWWKKNSTECMNV